MLQCTPKSDWAAAAATLAMDVTIVDKQAWYIGMCQNIWHIQPATHIYNIYNTYNTHMYSNISLELSKTFSNVNVGCPAM